MGIFCCCCSCCLDNLSSKTLEILLIAFHSIGVSFLICSLVIISWSKISYINLILVLLILLINVLCLIFIVFIRIWRKKKTIQTIKKKKGIIFSKISIIILIICFIISVIEEFILSYAFSDVDYPCRNKKTEKNDKNYGQFIFKISLSNNISTVDDKILRNLKDVDCTEHGKYYYTHEIKNEEYIISYFTFSFLQISLFLGIIIWIILKKRIILGIDKPPSMEKKQNVIYDQYGREVVIVNPGDVVIMGNPEVSGISMQSPSNNMRSLRQSQSINSQINPPNINSQEYRLQEKIATPLQGSVKSNNINN